MTPEQLGRLLEGRASDDEKKQLTAELASPSDETRATLEHRWGAEQGPDVFDAAFEAVHAPTPWWRRWLVPVALAAALAVMGVVTLQARTTDGVKGLHATPTLGLVVVSLDGVPRRVAEDEVLAAGARLGARVTVSQPCWLALEELRDGAWARVWPADTRGVRFEGGEHELGDAAGAVVLRVEPRPGPWRLRLVGSVAPLDTDGARGELERTVMVAP